MLSRLSVRDLAVIREAELEPGSGFTVLTGETGAGKSLLVDALGLVLGDRGAASLVRGGADRAGVTAEFPVEGNDALRAAIAARELPPDEVLTLHREIGSDGRSRAWVNGVPMPLAALRELGEALVEIHGQHEHLALARPAHQRALLDAYAVAQTLAAQVSEAAAAVRRAQTALTEARVGVADREAKLEFLRFQASELQTLSPADAEYEGLLAEYELLRHHERSVDALALALAALDEGETPALGALAAARAALSQLPSGAGEAIELLQQAEALTSEVSRQLRRLAEIEADPERLEWLNERIARYQSLARKHHCEPRELAARHVGIAAEITELDEGGERPARLERELAKARDEYGALAAQLSAKRARSAPRFTAAVTETLRDLGMPQAEFEATLQAVEDDACPAGGRELVVFQIAVNAGQSAGPIAQIASGGELSRIALAIEVLANAASGAAAMVFDEVDAGVSGRVAELVGRRLKSLAAHRQVLCVTHLPQVAALADRQYAVRKSSAGAATMVQVEILDAEHRVEAIAAMLAGLRVTDTARRHARDLIARAAETPDEIS